MNCKHEWRLIMYVSDGEYYFCKHCLAQAHVYDDEDRKVNITRAKWNTKSK